MITNQLCPKCKAQQEQRAKFRQKHRIRLRHNAIEYRLRKKDLIEFGKP